MKINQAIPRAVQDYTFWSSTLTVMVCEKKNTKTMIRNLNYQNFKMISWWKC